MSDINVPHYITVGIFALFPGLRRFIGILGLLGLIVGGCMAYSAYYSPQTVVINASPICDRLVFRTLSQPGPPPEWGRFTLTHSASGQSEWYVKEAHGSGWCLIKHDYNTTVLQNGMYGTLWAEVPSKYSARVQANADAQHHELSPHNWLILGILGFSLVILIGIWLPATIFAAVGRRFLKDVKEEPL